MDYCKTGREEKLILEGWGDSQKRFVGRGDKAEPRFFCSGGHEESHSGKTG